MSGKQSSPKKKSSHVQNRSKGNLGQKEARLEKEKNTELSRTGKKTRESEKSARSKGQSA
jgi:hypothetical protein